MRKNTLYYVSVLVLTTMLAATGCVLEDSHPNTQNPTTNASGLPRFTSEEELVTAFTEGRNQMQGEYVFQGAYVYNLTLKNGFSLKGKVTHYDTNDIFQKSGDYFYGGQSDITRGMYINNVLYTLSQSRLQLNDLTSMATLRVLPFVQ